jgi:hypothetical protein
LRYLEQFREPLLARALYRRYHQQGKHAFYSQFNISKPTFAPFKVVWRRMARDLIAAVVSSWNGPLGRKLVIPLETTAFIATQCFEEAHYLCALLNSTPARQFVQSFSAAGRGFGAPYAIGRLPLPEYDPENPAHRRLAELSEQRHKGNPAAAEELDAAAASVLGVSFAAGFR